jgi:hypothetical protein
MLELDAATPIAQVRGVDVLLTLNDVATIYRQSPSTIRGKLQKGLFRPPPVRKYPYRWRKADIERDLATQVHDDRSAKHGFAAKKKLARANPLPRSPRRAGRGRA